MDNTALLATLFQSATAQVVATTRNMVVESRLSHLNYSWPGRENAGKELTIGCQHYST